MEENRRILIVEDDPLTRRALVRALRSTGEKIDIEEESDGARALAAMRDGAFDCALLDYQLPGMDGLEVLRQARAAGIRLPIIILTAKGDEQLAVEMMKTGAADYVPKSRMSPERLLQSIRSAMRLHDAERRAAEAQERLRANEERLTRVLETAVDGIVILGLEGDFQFLNPAAQRILGFTHDDATRHTIFDLQSRHADGTALLEEERPLTRILRSGRALDNFEVLITRPDGRHALLSINGAPLLNADGSITQVVASIHDITEQKQAEQALRESQQLFQQFMGRSPAFAYMKDAAGRYIYLNETVSRVFRASPEDWLGRTARDVWPDEIGERVEAADRLVLHSGQPAELIDSLPHADGMHTWLVYRFPLVDAAGRRIIAGMGMDITERQRSEERLRDAEERYRTLFEHSPFGVIIVDPEDGRFVEFNSTAHRLLDYSREEFAELRVADLEMVETPAQTIAHLRAILQSGADEFETRLRDRHNEPRDILCSVRRLNIGGRTLLHAILQDITERNRLKEQLVQSQKMEAIGRLAGGVAHDFNNLLAVISGYSESLTRRLGEESPLRMHAEEIQRAAERGGSLTRQLLAFSRRQVIRPQVLDLNQVIRNLNEMLRRVISKEINIALTHGEHLRPVKADLGQMEQVILNLAINARDAMPSGGTLTIATRNRVLSDSAAAIAGVAPGPYTKLIVSDTGGGIDPKTRARIFEPFFTTKEGKGTGLGLSIVYGIVQQCGGNVAVRSAPGQGSTFLVYFPSAVETVEQQTG